MLSQQKNFKLFCDFLNRGSDEDIKNIEFFIKNDPKQHFYPRGSPQLICNQQDQNGKYPLYIACSMGNIALLKKLIQLGSDPNLLSIVYMHEKEQLYEGILEVSCRLGYVEIVEYLLQLQKWDRSIIQNCITRTDNEKIIQLLNKYYKFKKPQLCFKSIL